MCGEVSRRSDGGEHYEYEGKASHGTPPGMGKMGQVADIDLSGERNKAYRTKMGMCPTVAGQGAVKPLGHLSQGVRPFEMSGPDEVQL